MYQYRVHNIETLAPGDDSQVFTISKIQPQQARRLLQQTNVFKNCHNDIVRSCSQSPSWRPREDFTDHNGDNSYAVSSLATVPTVLATYRQIIGDSTTRCASQNMTKPGDQKNEIDRILVCVESARGLVLLEYVGRNG